MKVKVLHRVNNRGCLQRRLGWLGIFTLIIITAPLGSCNAFDSDPTRLIKDKTAGDAHLSDGDLSDATGCVANIGNTSCLLICPEVCDAKDNNCDGQTDEGDAVRSCELPNATAECRAGACTVATCAEGFGNCDGLDADGCEERVNTVNHCGTCGNDCTTLSNAATVSCNNSVCAVGKCKKDFDNCDGIPENGCETSLNTLTDCGKCRAVCSGQACQEGVCCEKTGYGDCDGNPDNGCETPLNTLTSCAKCGQKCELAHAIAGCESGTCTFLQCMSGYGNCDQDVSNGCEPLNTFKDCGVCGQKCQIDNAWARCQNGTCELVACKRGYDNCDGDSQNGCESSLTTQTNCAKCGVVCAKASCAGGVCTSKTCPSGYANCAGNGETCEVTLNTFDNCVLCGQSCALIHATATCWYGSCEVDVCDTGYEDCDGQAYNGCEAYLGDDVNNCGVCANRCVPSSASAALCISGSCR